MRLASHRRLRLVRIAVPAAMFGALTACGGGDGGQPACEDPVQADQVTMDDFSYVPTCVAAAPGAGLDVVNEGSAPHTFTVEPDGGEVDVPAGESAVFAVPDLAAGTYRVICTYHPQMEAALRIG